jgi:lipopolysaccharide export system protein LptA
MKFSKLLFGLLIAMTLGAGLSHAENADRNKPMNIEADALRYDDLKQTSVFSGRVVLTKGTIVIRGARMEVRQDPQGYQFGQVSAEPGKLAFFRQKREGFDEYIEGEADSIEYDGRADTVKFLHNAQLRRYRGAALSDEFTGGVILYNNTSGLFSIDGAAPKSGGAPSSGRVRAVLGPKPEAPASAAAPASVNPVLRPTTTLGGEKK